MGRFRWRAGDELAHEGGTIDTVAQFRAAEIEAPDQRHSIRDEIIHAIGELTKARIMPTHGDDVRVGKIDRGDALVRRKLKTMGAELFVRSQLQRRAQYASDAVSRGRRRGGWEGLAHAFGDPRFARQVRARALL